MSTNKKRKFQWPVWIVLLLSVAAAAVLCSGGKLLGLAGERIWMGPEVFDDRPFDRAKWLGYEKNKDPNIRERMFHDLRRNRLRRGMHQTEVERMLGEPNGRHGNAWDYYLGPDALKMDTSEMIIYFDEAGRLVNVTWSTT